MLARQRQARLWNRNNSNFPKTQGPVARKKSQKATQILRAGNFLPTPRGNPRKWGPGPTPPVRGRWPEGPEGVGWATMSTKCSSGAVPGGVLGYLSRTPGEAQRSGFAGKRRSKEAVAVFAARRKRRQADFATTSRHGQSHSPPAGGETPLRKQYLKGGALRSSRPTQKTALPSPPHPALRATFPPRGRLFGGIISSSVWPSASHLSPGGRLIRRAGGKM